MVSQNVKVQVYSLVDSTTTVNLFVSCTVHVLRMLVSELMSHEHNLAPQVRFGSRAVTVRVFLAYQARAY